MLRSRDNRRKRRRSASSEAEADERLLLQNCYGNIFPPERFHVKSNSIQKSKRNWHTYLLAPTGNHPVESSRTHGTPFEQSATQNKRTKHATPTSRRRLRGLPHARPRPTSCVAQACRSGDQLSQQKIYRSAYIYVDLHFVFADQHIC